MAELKPCPFCGGRARIKKLVVFQGFAVTCEKCGADVYFYEKEFSQSETIIAWNRRATEKLEHEKALKDAARIVAGSDWRRADQ